MKLKLEITDNLEESYIKIEVKSFTELKRWIEKIEKWNCFKE